MIKRKDSLTYEAFLTKIQRFWELSAEKISSIQKNYDESQGAPVFTKMGKYTTRGWTEWTQGFQYGSEILQFDATGDILYLEAGRKHTVEKMAPHISHTGVHDHGFNNVSTYGNLLRLMIEDKIPTDAWEKNYYELALKISGTVQATRWTNTIDGGFIHSFNGPHSLFVDTIRSLRILILSHLLGHKLQGENDVKINLFERALLHAKATASYAVYYGEGRDSYDVWGRTAHESIFNTTDGRYRCPNAQQGYTGFSTWTRGLAWAMCGFAEQLEVVQVIDESEFPGNFTKQKTLEFMLKAAKATCDFYIENTPSDGIPYWDTGAPNLHKLGDYLNKAANPFNEFEPVDSSAAAIAAQGLLRLGNYLKNTEPESAKKYTQTGLTVLETLLDSPYLSTDQEHQGILLHTIYHEPNGWDFKPQPGKVAFGESCMWGDYHMRELVLYVQRLATHQTYYTFYNCIDKLFRK